MPIRILAVIAALVFVAPAFAQVQRVEVTGPYTQAASGMVFPETVGSFRRASIARYNPDGSDESAGYTMSVPSGMAVATVYVYRSAVPASPGSPPQAIVDQFNGAKAAITQSHGDAQLVSDDAVTHDFRGGSVAGRHAVYRLTMNMGGSQRRAQSELYVFGFVGSGWIVKYRITYPENANVSAAVAEFMTALKWTIRAGGE
jgi:hypothetical protein